MADAVWNGFLRVSLVSCPVALSPAIKEGNGVRLDQLNARTGNPVTQQFLDAKTGVVVPSDALAQGCQVEDGGYVPISDAELATVTGEPSDVVELAQFVPRDQIDRTITSPAYYIHPNGSIAADTLHALRVAMLRSGRAGLGCIHIGGRERNILVEPHGVGLLASTIHNPPQLEPTEFAERADDEIPAEMVEIAEAIIGRRSAAFDAASLRDLYEDRLRTLISEKARHPAPEPPAPPPAPIPEPMPEPAAAAPPEPPASAVEAASPPPELPPPTPPAPPPPLPPAPEPVVQAAPEPEPPPQPPEPHPEPPPPPEPVVAAAPEPEPEPAPEPEPPPEPAPAPEPPPPEPAAAAEPPPAPAAAVQETSAQRAPDRLRVIGDPDELGTEILLHIMGLGDRRYIEPGWAGNPGSRRQVEAISIRPRDSMLPSAVEFRVFAQEGRATAWVSNGNYAGTRGRGLPLTGFAVRPAPDHREDMEIVYEGCFFEGGVVGPKRNGELCISPIDNDPLEAIRVSMFPRAPQ